MREITRKQANELINKHWHTPQQKLVICAFGKWYDIRGMSNEQIRLASHKLIAQHTGIPVTVREPTTHDPEQQVQNNRDRERGTMPLDQAHLDRKAELEALESRDENQEKELADITKLEAELAEKESQTEETTTQPADSQPDTTGADTTTVNPPQGNGEAPADAGDVTPQSDQSQQ